MGYLLAFQYVYVVRVVMGLALTYDVSTDAAILLCYLAVGELSSGMKTGVIRDGGDHKSQL